MEKEEIVPYIVELFSHYSKDQKLAICRFLSFCSTFPFGEYRQLGTGINSIMPWRAETIITIILMNLDSVSLPIKFFPSTEFDFDLNAVMDIFQEFEKPPYSDEHVSLYGINGVLGPLLTKQITYQRYIYTKLYRFNYIFTFDNFMASFFKKKTGLDDYFVYTFLGQIQTAYVELYGNNKNIFSFIKYQQFLDDVYKTYSDYLKPLICDLSKIIPSQSLKCDINRFDELHFSYKCLCERPILLKDNVPFPVALHCMDFACTEGLLLNITSSEKKVIDYIGPILEKYTYHLLEENNLYFLPEESKRNKHYKVDGEDKLPADAIAKNDESILIFEAKERQYKRKIFINDLESLSDEYSFLVGAVKQLLDYYKHLVGGFYNPFKDNSDKHKEVFLILVKLFYVSVNVDVVIEDVVKDPEYSSFKEYLHSHLLITDFDTIELFLLHKKDIVEALHEASNNNELNPFAKYRPSCYHQERSVSFNEFMNKLRKKEEEQIAVSARKIKNSYKSK